MGTFEQKMKAFDKKMEAMEPKMKEFDKKMAEFDEQMKPLMLNENFEKYENLRKANGGIPQNE
jgi:phage shock protein A